APLRPRGVCAGEGAGGMRASGAQRSDELHLIQENKSAFQFEVHEAIKLKLVKALEQFGQLFEADNVRNCHSTFFGWGCKQGHRWAKPGASCQHKLCPFDMRARRLRLVKKYRPLLQRMAQPRYIVFSKENCAFDELGAGIASLWSAFEKLRHRKIWKSVKAAIAALEVTYNAETHTWHPHINVLFDGRYIPQADLLAQWNELHNGCADAGVWIEMADFDSLEELFKYITKLVDFVGNAEAVELFLKQTKGLRFVRAYGECYDTELDDEPGGMECPDCGSRDIFRLGHVKPEQLWLDDGGVYRYWERATAESPPESPPWSLEAEIPHVDVNRRLGFGGVLGEVRAEMPSLFAAAD
ncbi:MAG: protein rep, partial [Acidobacteriales bacterium]|nr:protein rep [Terriglobales bacterium]